MIRFKILLFTWVQGIFKKSDWNIRLGMKHFSSIAFKLKTIEFLIFYSAVWKISYQLNAKFLIIIPYPF